MKRSAESSVRVPLSSAASPRASVVSARAASAVTCSSVVSAVASVVVAAFEMVSSRLVKAEIWPVASATDFVTEEKSASACWRSPEEASRFARIWDTRSWFTGPSSSETLFETVRISFRISGASSLSDWRTERPGVMFGIGSSEAVARSASPRIARRDAHVGDAGDAQRLDRGDRGGAHGRAGLRPPSGRGSARCRRGRAPRPPPAPRAGPRSGPARRSRDLRRWGRSCRNRRTAGRAGRGRTRAGTARSPMNPARVKAPMRR